MNLKKQYVNLRMKISNKLDNKNPKEINKFINGFWGKRLRNKLNRLIEKMEQII